MKGDPSEVAAARCRCLCCCCAGPRRGACARERVRVHRPHERAGAAAKDFDSLRVRTSIYRGRIHTERRVSTLGLYELQAALVLSCAAARLHGRPPHPLGGEHAMGHLACVEQAQCRLPRARPPTRAHRHVASDGVRGRACGGHTAKKLKSTLPYGDRSYGA